MAKRERIELIDAARGVAILAMLVHHFLISYGMVFGTDDLPLVNEPYFEALHFFFVSVFLLISGTCSHFSKNNIKRGLIVLAAALVVTLVTLVALPRSPIYFGILHLLGCCMVLYGPLGRSLMDNLYIFDGTEHNMQAQKPKAIDINQYK